MLRTASPHSSVSALLLVPKALEDFTLRIHQILQEEYDLEQTFKSLEKHRDSLTELTLTFWGEEPIFSNPPSSLEVFSSLTRMSLPLYLLATHNLKTYPPNISSLEVTVVEWYPSHNFVSGELHLDVPLIDWVTFVLNAAPPSLNQLGLVSVGSNNTVTNTTRTFLAPVRAVCMEKGLTTFGLLQ